MSCIPYSLSYELTVSILREFASQETLDSGSVSAFMGCSDADLNQIRSILQRLTASRVQNVEDAEDLVQETLLTVAAKCPSAELQKGLLVWSIGVLRKKVGNYYRRTRRLGFFPQMEDGEWLSSQALVLLKSPESELRHSELRALIHNIVANLPPKEKSAMRMMLSGLPAQEIAQNMAPESYQNVLNHLHRGKRKLGEQLAKHGYLSKIPRKRRMRKKLPATGNEHRTAPCCSATQGP